MKKVSCLITIAVFLSIAVMGQFSKENDLSYISKKLPGLENLQNSTIKDLNTVIYYQKKQRTTKLYPLKSAMADTLKLDSCVMESWDETNSLWIHDSKSKYTYDITGKNIMAIDYDWDETSGIWENSYKIEIMYNVNGNITVYISSEWDDSNTEWTASSKEEYLYNTNGFMSSVLYFEWNETDVLWDTVIKAEYFHGFNDMDTLNMFYTWNEIDNQWNEYYKTKYTYDTNENITLYEGYLWNDTTSQWDSAYKIENVYDTIGNNTLSVTLLRNESGIEWYTLFKTEMIWDINRNMTDYIIYRWDEISQQFIPAGKSDFSYNNSFSFSDLFLPYDFTADLFFHMITSVISYDYDETDWTISDSTTYYYSTNKPTYATDRIQSTDIRVFPNPATDHVVFYLDGNSDNFIIELYDIGGRKVLSQNAYEGTPVFIQNLSKGLYMYKLNNKGIVYSGKLLVE